jgi:hypothetical protein
MHSWGSMSLEQFGKLTSVEADAADVADVAALVEL